MAPGSAPWPTPPQSLSASFLAGHLPLDLRSIWITQDDLKVFNYIRKHLFFPPQMGSHSQDPGIRMWTYLLGNRHLTCCTHIDYRWIIRTLRRFHTQIWANNHLFPAGEATLSLPGGRELFPVVGTDLGHRSWSASEQSGRASWKKRQAEGSYD